MTPKRGSHWQWDGGSKLGNGAAFWGLAVAAFALDWLTKRIAMLGLPRGYRNVEHRDLLELRLVFNSGGPMGIDLGRNAQELLGFLAIFLLALLYLWYRNLPGRSHAAAAGLGLIAGGGAGNALDRLTSEHGVIDFIELGYGPYRSWTVNGADLAIILGIVWLLALAWRMHGPSGPTRGRRKKPPQRG